MSGLLLLAAAASALAPGEFDSTFGSGGKVITQFGTGPTPGSFASAVVRQPDGRIVVGGTATDGDGKLQLTVARLNEADGSLDSSFGSGGVFREQVGVGANPFSEVSSIALQPDGKIVVGGAATDADGKLQLMVARLNAEGSFDSSFGGGGKVLTQLGSGVDPSTRVSGLGLQPDGKIVVVGEVAIPGDTQFMVVRLNGADGSFDSSFANGGMLVTQLGRGPTRPQGRTRSCYSPTASS